MRLKIACFVLSVISTLLITNQIKAQVYVDETGRVGMYTENLGIDKVYVYNLDQRIGLKVWSNMNTTASKFGIYNSCLLYTSPSPRDQRGSRMPSSA